MKNDRDPTVNVLLANASSNLNVLTLSARLECLHFTVNTLTVIIRRKAERDDKQVNF